MPATRHETELLEVYRAEAAAAADEFRALDYLVTAADGSAAMNECFEILARRNDGSDPFDLRTVHAEARRDVVMCARRLEVAERAHAAGVNRHSALCECAHAGRRHAQIPTDDGRIPCTEDGCRCDDLRFVPEAGA